LLSPQLPVSSTLGLILECLSPRRVATKLLPYLTDPYDWVLIANQKIIKNMSAQCTTHIKMEVSQLRAMFYIPQTGYNNQHNTGMKN